MSPAYGGVAATPSGDPTADLESVGGAGDGPDRDVREDAAEDPAPLQDHSRRIDRWGWGLGVALFLVAAGLAVQASSLLVAAMVPLAFVAYGAVTGLPSPELRVEREVAWSATAPGEPVEVTLHLANEGEETLADVRVVDRVPHDLPVIRGSPRAAVDLDPGEAVTVEYAVGARRGVHEFAGVRLRVRNTPGSALADGTSRADGDRAVECELPVEEVPLAHDTVLHPGAVSADEHGEGIEFYSVREYRRGDDPSDLDWRRYARTGELTTVRYREERAATVVLVVDTRDDTYVSATDSMPSGARLSAFAAERAFEALAHSHHEVGLATLRAGHLDWVDPGADAATLAAARETIADVYDREPLLTVTSLADRSGTASTVLANLQRRLPGRAQVVFFTPAIDRFPEHVVRGLIARGRAVTVVTPTIVTEDVPAQHLAGAERATRLAGLRAAGARVVEWDREEPLPIVLDRVTAWGGRP